jgi:hypothetical protein
VAEAVACYRAGAFRAAIVTTWIALVFDFLHKLRQLAASNDREATLVVEEYERCRADQNLGGALKFEREVLERAELKFELIAHFERQDLDRLLEDRNRCAHPSQRDESERYEPTAELVRLHIRNAVTHLFQHQPTQGKAALTAIEAEIRSPTFPSSDDRAREVLRHGPLARPKAALLRNAVLLMLKWLLTKGVQNDEANRVAAAFNAVVDLHRANVEAILAEPAVADIVRNASLGDRTIHVVRALALVRSLQAAVRDDTLVILEPFVENVADDAVDMIIHFASDVSRLRGAVVKRLQRVKRPQLAALIALRPRPVYVDRALQLYVAASTFANADEMTGSLVLPLVDYFEREHGTKIRRASETVNSQVGQASKFGSVKARLIERQIWLDDAE